jgi:hypothetical protein
MNAWRTWLARLGLAGACALIGGCGGGVPDPSADPQASAEPAADGGAAPIGPKADAAPPAAAPETASADAPKAEAPQPDAAAPAPAQAENSPPAKAQGGSTTAEMLAMATGPGNPSPPASGGGASAPSAPQGGGAQPPAAGAPGAPPQSAPGGPGMGMMPMAPGRGGGSNQADMAKMMQQNQANMQAQMKNRSQQQSGQGGMPGPGGMPGAPGGPGGGAAEQDDGPGDFRSPIGAVRAFLSAVKAKDADRLNEATAIRAPGEADSKKNRDTFKKIVDLALSDSEFDELAKNLEGYRVMGENPQKIIGRVDVVARKPGENGSYSQRTFTVKHEKKGWGVLNVSPSTVFKAMGTIRRPRPR